MNEASMNEAGPEALARHASGKADLPAGALSPGGLEEER